MVKKSNFFHACRGQKEAGIRYTPDSSTPKFLLRKHIFVTNIDDQELAVDLPLTFCFRDN